MQKNLDPKKNRGFSFSNLTPHSNKDSKSPPIH